MKKVLITGGAGFIGRNLSTYFLNKNYQVVIYDNFSRSPDVSTLNSQIEVISGDVRSKEKLILAMDGCDAVIHLAAYGSVIESISDPLTNFEQNVVGTFMAIEAAREAGVRKFIFASTGGAIMGNTSPPVNENSLPRPISPYGASKLCGEAYIFSHAGSYKMDTMALRFGNVYGPESAHKKGAITTFIKCLLQDKPITIYGSGNASRDYLHVNDLCNGIFLATEKNDTNGEVFHLANEIETTVLELAGKLKEIAGLPKHEVVHLPIREGEVERNFADYSKAKIKFGFSPKINLDEGLESTWNWFNQLPKNLLEIDSYNS